MGVNAAGAYGWQTYHLHVLFVLKSESLNLLEPSGPVQACNGIALPLPFYIMTSERVDSFDQVLCSENFVQICRAINSVRLCTGRSAHRGSIGIALLFLDHGTRRGERSASRPGRSLLPGKTHCTWGWVVPRAGLDRCGKSRPLPGFDPRTVQPVARRYTDYATLPTDLLHNLVTKFRMVFGSWSFMKFWQNLPLFKIYWCVNLTWWLLYCGAWDLPAFLINLVSLSSCDCSLSLR